VATLRRADHVVRLGGEEFAVVLPNTALADATDGVAVKLYNAIQEASTRRQLAEQVHRRALDLARQAEAGRRHRSGEIAQAKLRKAFRAANGTGNSVEIPTPNSIGTVSIGATQLSSARAWKRPSIGPPVSVRKPRSSAEKES